MIQGVVTVYRISTLRIPIESAMACMTNDELLRVSRFKFSEDARQWAACRASLRKILGGELNLSPIDVPLTLSEFGKPGLAPPFDSLHFNLSHCADLAIVAVGIDGPVGIDIEKLDRARDLLECTATFCHPAEIEELPADMPLRARQLLRIWTAKEAVLKALGTGFSHPPEITRIVFETQGAHAASDSPLAGIETQRLHELKSPELYGHQGFVSVPYTVQSINFSESN